MKKRRKTKLWKKVLVGFMSLTMFLGNLSTLSIEAYAATEDVLFNEDEKPADTDYEPTAPVVEELEEDIDYTVEEETDETVYYTVTYYDADGALLGSTQFAEGSELSMPVVDGEAYWTDADGIEYVEGDAVYDDLSLFVVVDDTVIEDEVEEDLPEDQILVYAVLKDTDGEFLDEFRITEDMYLAVDEDNDAPVVEGYEFTGAKLDMTPVTEILVDETEDGLLVYTVDGVELEADADIVLTYESTEFEYNISVEVVDEDGAVIKGYETVEAPEIDGTLDLADMNNAPVEVEGYEYVGASIAGEPVYSITIEPDDAYYEIETGFADIESDLLITLTYAELAVPTVLTATIVDEFGDEIDEKYTEMELPEFDADGILVLDDPELPPVEDVKVKTGLFRSIKYTYVKATIDNKIITALQAEEAAGGLGTYYSYTVDGENWIKLKEDTTVYFEYSDGKKTTYTYEDGYVRVTATLQHANAIPDDAYFAVTPLTAGSGYDVDTYLDALNAKADTPADAEDFKYTSENTLLYDIAFYTDETMTEEIEPADGMVKTEIVFLQNQLTDDLEADDKAELLINHVSLGEGVVEEAGTTANANVSVGSLNVETIAADVSVAGESIAFSTEGYSVFTITSPALSKKIKIRFQTTDGAAVSTDKLPNAYLYVYKVTDQNQHALIKLDGSIGEFDNGVITIGADELKSSSLKSFNYGSDLNSYYGVEIWQPVSPEKASNASIDSTYDKNNFIRRVPITETGEVPELVDMYKFTFPRDDFESTADYEITATQVGVGAYTDAPSMLGEAAGYGVIANTYHSHADTQTNFAVKKFIGRASGDTGATGADMANNPGTSYAGEIENLLQVKNNLGASVIYYGDTFTQDSNGNQKLYYKANGDLFIQDDSGKATVTNMSQDMINAKVDSLISGIRVASGDMITLPGAAADVSDAPYYLDTSKLPGGTIHIDLDSSVGDGLSLYDVWSTSQNVYINKNSNQTLVFHSSKDSVTLKEYNICNDGSGSYMTSASPASAGETNVKLADVCNTMIFDLPNATSLEFASAVAGMFYAPNATVSWHTACCGWLICDYARGVDGEWHFIYQHVPNPVVEDDGCTLELAITKHLIDDNTEQAADASAWPEEGFTFKISKYLCDDYQDVNRDLGVLHDADLIPDLTGMENGEKYVTIKADQADQRVVVGTVDFQGSSVWNDSRSYEWNENGVLDHKYMVFMYKIEEQECSDEKITIDSKPYYVKFFVNCKQIRNGDDYKYYVWVDGPHVANIVTEVNACEPKEVELTNHYRSEYETGEIKITKEVVGKDSADNVEYEFKLFGQSWSRYPERDLGGTLVFTSDVRGEIPHTKQIEYINGVGKNKDREVFYFNLLAGETVTISGIPIIPRSQGNDGATVTNEYYIQEVESTTDADMVYVKDIDNFQPDSANPPQFNLSKRTDNFSEKPVASITYVNVYYSGLTIEKTIAGYDKDLTAEQKQQITFTVTGPSFPDGTTVTYDQFTDGKYTFSNLLRGEYTVTESGQDIDSTYTCETTYSNGGKATIDGDHNGTVSVTNTYTYNVTEVSGSKTWEDNDNQDGLRPESITITLLANGVQAEGVEPKTVSAADNWAWTFTDLPKYDSNGEEIRYTITESEVAEYTAEYTSDHLSVINTHVPEETSVSVSKRWAGDAGNTELRPEKITVKLLANGEETGKTADLSANNSWTYTFEKLPVKNNKQPITYTVEEVAVEYYDSEITGSAADGFVITNTFIPTYVTVSGKKVWDDASNQDGKRPSQVILYLYANSEQVATQVVEGTGDTWSWDWSFKDLPKYQNGRVINYTVGEVSVRDYSTDITGNEATADGNKNNIIITNHYTPGVTSVNGTKTWQDNGNQDGMRPTSIQIVLYKTVKGVTSEVDRKTISSSDNWSYSWENLPDYETGTKITYSVDEEPVKEHDLDAYSKTISGCDITNTHTPESISISGSKKWEDADNQDGIRPESVTIELHKNGSDDVIDTATASESTGWKWNFNNLPKYENGEKIVYYVTEANIEAYTSSPASYVITQTEGTGANNTGLVFTNTHTPATVIVTGEKTWDDADNQDGIRPTSITVTLYADGVATNHVKTVTAEDGWKWMFTDLPKKVAGKEIQYTVVENVITGYVAEYSEEGIDPTTHGPKLDIKNTHTPALIEISGTKTWDDNDNQDGARPASITVNLLADGNVVRTETVTADSTGAWAYTFTGLPQKAGGKDIVYTVTEDAVTGYTTEINGYDITNRHTPEKISINGTKTWSDNDNQDGKRPAAVTINLLKNGTPIDSVTATKDNNWTWSFTDLNKYEGGVKIAYTVTEEPVEGYETTPENGYVVTSADSDVVNNADLVFTNTHIPEKTQIGVAKIWKDDGNRDNKRPASITVNLLADNEIIETITLSETTGWTHTFENLDKYVAGKEIVYTISEESVEDYTSTYDTKDGVTTITNSYTPGETSISGKKVWDDANDQDHLRTGTVTIKLFADNEYVTSTTASAIGNWEWEFTGLPVYKSGAVGQKINYTIGEEAVGGYTKDISLVENTDNQYIVTNTHIPQKISISGSKTWTDNNNQDGIRPNSITIRLNATKANMEERTATATAPAYNWSFTGLPKFKDGVEIIYSVSEDAVTGYESSAPTVGAKDDDGNISNIMFTNTHTPATVDVSGFKTWNDNDNQDGIRPASVTIQLYADGEPVAGKSKEVTAATEWRWSFTDLPRYAGGHEIGYSVLEVEPDASSGYELVSTSQGTKDGSTGNISGIEIINKHEPAKLSISGTKSWQDNGNQDNVRPQSVTIILYKTVDGTKSKVTETTTDAGKSWAWSFNELPKLEAGKLIRYSVEEMPVDKYTRISQTTGTSDSAGNTTGIVITNRHIPETVSINGTKNWDDNNNQDGKRPASIVLNLYKNGSDNPVDTKVITPTEAEKATNSWSWSFTGLPKFENEGQLITYTVREVAVTGYEEPIYSNNGLTITNKRVPETTKVEGIKVWDDNNNQDGKRTTSVTVRLFAGETEIDHKTVDSSTNWNFSFDNLPKYANGQVITYTVSEDTVTGYSTKVEGNPASANPFYTITNSYSPGKVTISGTKGWTDNNNQDGIRPASVKINLLANGTKVDSTIATAAGGWSWKFEDKDEYSGGSLIAYTVEEEAVNEGELTGYTSAATQTAAYTWSIVNTHTPEEITVSGEKTWDDASNRDGVRPESITVKLLADGVQVQSATVSADNDGKWKYSFTDLPKYKTGGTEIVYSVDEDVISGRNGKTYTAEIKGYNIKNTYIPDTVKISGSKTWNDSDNRDAVRPGKIVIYLKADGDITQTKEVIVAADGSASWEFNDLPKYRYDENAKEAVEIVYTIDEAPITNEAGDVVLYDYEVSGYDVINTHDPETVDIEGHKEWADDNNNDKLRPGSIEIQLLADGKPVDGKKITVTAANNWSWKFEDMPKYEAGRAIQYSVAETPVTGYTAKVDGAGSYVHTVTNTHEREYVGLKVTKNWIGGVAAVDSVEISVEGRIADGSIVVAAQKGSISKSNGWTLEIKPEDKKLPKNYMGEEIQYYVSEIVPDGAKYVQVDATGAKVTGATKAAMADGIFTADVYNLALTQITVKKQWEKDPGYYGGNDYVEVSLLADGAVYKTAQVKASEGWAYTFTDLPVYSASGDKITYTAVENTRLADYNTSTGGLPVIDYKQLDENGTIIIKNVLDPLTLTVHKIWLGDPAGTKHDDITVRIMSSVPTSTTAVSVFDRIRKVLGADSNKWYEYTSVTLGESNNWTAEVEDLPRFAKVGNDIVRVSYAVEEPNVPEGYTSVTNVDGSIATVINTGYTSVAGFKTWDDGSNVVGYRPGSADFAALIGLYQDGKQYMTGTDATHFRWLDTSGDTWSFEFYDLPAGHTYTIGELARVLGYGEPTIDGYTIRNPLEFTQIGVTKVWDDMDNAYASRPASIAFRLLANGAQANITGVTPIVTLDNVNGASYIWKNLPVNDRNGNKIAYNVEEVSVPSGYTANVRRDDDMFIITNSFRPAETQLTVTKVWDDENDAAGIRPTSIQVALTRNGADVETVTLSAANGWSHTWSGLPTILSDGSGTRAEYSVREVSQILGYSVSISGSGEVYTITNYYRGTDTPPTPPTEGGEEGGTTRGGSRTPTQPPYTIPDEPTPLAGLSEVLGARRAPASSVLGARRSPQTGDASNAGAFIAAMASAGAMMGAWFSMRKRKKG